VSFGLRICILHLSLFSFVPSGVSMATSGSIRGHCNCLVSRGVWLVAWGELIATCIRICF
jgi:hypothetical protein